MTGDLRRLRSSPLLRALPLTAGAVDLAVIATSIALAALLRGLVPFLDNAASVADGGIIGGLIAAGWLTMIFLRGGYQAELFGAGMDEFKRVVTGSTITAGVVGIACYLVKYQLSRGFFLLAFLIGIPALVIGRFALRKVLHRTRQRGHLRKKALLVGSPGAIDEVAHVLQRETWVGYEVVGALTPPTDLSEETPSGIPVLANADDAALMAEKVSADAVILAGGGIAGAGQMRQLTWALEEAHTEVIVVPSMTDISEDRIKMRPVGGLPLLHVGRPRATEALSWAKRAFDVIGSLALMVVFAPVMLFVALRVEGADRGPVFFRQERIGRSGQPFTCLKFRTMVVDAEERLAALVAQEGHAEGLFKMKQDPRVTRPGRWMRRYSLDELPQLWNVLRGDMSLVGPRPPLPSEVLSYDVNAHRRLSVRPGMTGLWQVSGRSDLTWGETVRLDTYYVDNWSMVQDLAILAKTVKVMVSPEGAY